MRTVVGSEAPEAERAEADAARRGPRPRGCEGLYWLESYAQRLFMMVEPGPAEQDAFFAKTGKQAAVDDKYETWIGPTVEQGVGGWASGDKVRPVDFRGPHNTSDCSITGFTSITRGIPHSGYLQSVSDSGPPESPGCGSPVAFAELACHSFNAGSGHVGWGYHHHRPAPVFYESHKTNNPAVVEATVRLVQDDAFFSRRTNKLQSMAAGIGEPLQTEHGLRVFRYEASAYWLLESKFWTGEGENECGGEDIVEKYLTVLSDRQGRPGEIMVGPVSYEREIRGMVDVDADGVPELHEDHEFTAGLILESLDLEGRGLRRVCQNTIDFCDCGC